MQNCIKEQREKKGMSRKELAQRMQVDWSTVWRWEEEQVDVPWDVLIKIAVVLDVAPIDLVPTLAARPAAASDTGAA